MRIVYQFMCLQILIACHDLKGHTPINDKDLTINNYNINVNVLDFTKGYNDMLNYIQGLGTQKSQTSLSWLKNNQSKIVLTGLVAMYGYLANKIASGKAILYHNASWANWKNDTNLSELLTKAPSQLSRELNQSILDKYANNSQTDLITPLLCFNNDIAQEIQILRALSRISRNLKRLKLKMFFLLKDRDLELTDEKINRLLYLKNIINNAIHVSLNN